MQELYWNTIRGLSSEHFEIWKFMTFVKNVLSFLAKLGLEISSF